MLHAMNRTIQLPYDNGSLDFPIPDTWTLKVAAPTPWPDTEDFNTMLVKSLAAPLGAPGVETLARGAAKVAVVITDATRPCPDAELLPPLMEALQHGGVLPTAITVVIALGMHRKSTPEELETKLGKLPDGVQIVESQGSETDEFVSLGTVSRDSFPADVPVEIHRSVAQADLVLATGIVEPHQYAGYSGGRKTVAIGCASKNTIGVLHGTAFLDHNATRLGQIESNPVHLALEEIAARTNLKYVINVVRDSTGKLAAIASGNPTSVLEHLVRTMAPHTWTDVGSELFDVVLLGVGAPKDANLYQASRALTYLAYSPSPPIRDQGLMVLAAACREGAGLGPGEQEFQNQMCGGKTPAATRDHLRRDGFGAGGQRAYMVAGALERYRALVVGAQFPELIAEMGFSTASTPGEAVAMIHSQVSDPRVLAVPHALSTLAIKS
jgi:nickel-dependent lactate racemase